MATVYKWTPFEVALDLTATGSTITRTSATQYTVKINASWETYYSGAKTNYGMTASSGGSSVSLNTFGTKASSGSGSFTGTYSISGNASASKTITVTFKNYNTDNGDSATKTVSFTVTVPAWTSYKITYNANGGSGTPSSQTKWKDQTLTLSTTKPTRTGYTFLGWSTSSSATSATYSAGGSYTANSAATLYAVWKAITYTVKFNANGGTGAPGNQTKTYGVSLTLSNTKPSRTNYTFKGWGVAASSTTVSYAAGASYTSNASVTLYAIWSLAYTKPRITNCSVSRCDSDGTASDEGVCARVKFTWACDYSVSSIVIDWGLTSSSTLSESMTISASGTSGTVDVILSDFEFNTESTYTFKITVTDSNGSNSVTKTLDGMLFVIDFKSGGNGVAFGKPAELNGYADSKFKMMLRDGAYLINGKALYGKSTDDTNMSLIYVNAYDNTVIGYGSYVNSIGSTHLYGNHIRFLSNNSIYANGCRIAENKVLWSGSYYMTDSQTATLSEAISAQANGIILAWSYYVDGAAENSNFQYAFVPKYHIATHETKGISCWLTLGSGSTQASKYVYISDSSITGYSNNNATAYTASSGITLSPRFFVLRYVIGV